MRDFDILIDLARDAGEALCQISQERLDQLVPVVMYHFKVEVGLVELCNAYALLPAFSRIVQCFNMLAQPDSTTLLIERH